MGCVLGIILTHRTGISIEDGDPILKLLQGVSCPEIQLGVDVHSELGMTSKVLNVFST